MKIGKETTPRTAISTSSAHTIIVRGHDLAADLIGRISFTDHFYLLVTGRMPTPIARSVLDATLVAIAEHGLVPSVQASRMTLAAAPDALQGAVAAGLLGCGSVILGASESAGKLLEEVRQHGAETGAGLIDAARAVLSRYRADNRTVPGYGHPQHKTRDPRVAALFSHAEREGADLTYVRVAEAIEMVVPEAYGKKLMLNVSAAIPAVLLGIGFPLASLKGVPILARTAGLIGHLTEEIGRPIGFALSYQASREIVYDGELPEGYVLDV